MKLWNRASRGQSVTSLRFIHSRALPSSTTSSSLSTTSLTSHSATDRKSQTYSYSHSGCFVFPSFFIKLPKQKSGRPLRSVVPSLPAQLARGPAPFRWLVCPLPTPLSPVSRCGPSAAGGAIGKQRPKMRFPVSFSLLTNNQTERSRTLRYDRVIYYSAHLSPLHAVQLINSYPTY